MDDLVRLTVEFSVEADHVAVTYRVINDGPEPVYVIEGTFRLGPGGGMTWSDRLRVGFRPPATAILGSRLVPLNPLVHSRFPPAAFAVCLAAGEAYEGTLTARLPLVPDGMTVEPVTPAVVVAGKRLTEPFAGRAPLLADQPVVCHEAVFELGVVRHDESLCPQPTRLADRDVVRLEKAAWGLQRIVTAARPAELPMLVP